MHGGGGAATPNDVSFALAQAVITDGEHRRRATLAGPSKSWPWPERVVSPSIAKYTSPFEAMAPPSAYHHKWSSLTFCGGRNDWPKSWEATTMLSNLSLNAT